MPTPKKKTQGVVKKVWAVISQEGYLSEVSMYRSVAIKRRNSYFEHDPEHWPIKRLRKVFTVVPATIVYNFNSPRRRK